MCQDEKTAVILRIEGKTRTIFEGPVSTCGHRVTTRSGGTHHCNGTNNDNNPCPGPTCTTALDDADKVGKFGFDGYYDWRRDDFFITSISTETPAGNDYWAICRNLVPLEVGGCQQIVKKDDEVLFAYATQGQTVNFLKLTGPDWSYKGEVTFEVKNGEGIPIRNSDVNGHLTNDKGQVSIMFDKEGTYKLKAEKKPDSVRSNQHTIVIRLDP